MQIEVEVLIVVEDGVGNLLIILTWRTSPEVFRDDLLDAEVWMYDQLLKPIVDLLDVH